MTASASIYIAWDGQCYGPFSREDCVNGLATGHLSNEDLACTEDLPEWKPLHDLIGVKAILVPSESGQWNVQILSYSDPRITTRIAA